MKLHVKALLLSAFILPGLGQLYKGDRLKAAILITLVNVFLLMALFLVLQGLGPLIASSYFSNPADTARLVEQLAVKTPAAKWLLGSFIILWVYGSVDAAVGKSKALSDTMKD